MTIWKIQCPLRQKQTNQLGEMLAHSEPEFSPEDPHLPMRSTGWASLLPHRRGQCRQPSISVGSAFKDPTNLGLKIFLSCNCAKHEQTFFLSLFPKYYIVLGILSELND